MVVCALVTGCAPIADRLGGQEQDPRYDNFAEDFPAIRAQQRGRSRHKALAYGLLAGPTGPFVAGWAFGHDNEGKAVDRAMSECRDRMNDKPVAVRGHCVLYSVNGQVVQE